MTSEYFRGQTQIPRIPTEDSIHDFTSETDVLLIDRIETLTNQTGQLRSEVRERPLKHNTQIRDLGENGYDVLEPILITIEEYISEDNVIACFPEVEVFGEGVTEAEAITNLKQGILDLYDELDEIPKEELGNLPSSWQKILRKIISKTKE